MTAADAAEDLDVLLDLVGALTACRRVQRRARCGDIERRAAVEAEDIVHLPPAQNLRQHPFAQPTASLAERQLRDVGYVQRMRAIEGAEGTIQMVELRDLDSRCAVAVRGPLDTDRLRERIADAELVAGGQPVIEPGLQRVVLRIANRRDEKRLGGPAELF